MMKLLGVKYATDGDFRTNYSRGATVQESFITLEEEHCRSTRACGTRWIHDFMQ